MRHNNANIGIQFNQLTDKVSSLIGSDTACNTDQNFFSRKHLGNLLRLSFLLFDFFQRRVANVDFILHVFLNCNSNRLWKTFVEF